MLSDVTCEVHDESSRVAGQGLLSKMIQAMSSQERQIG